MQPEPLVALLAMVFCLQIGTLFGIIYWRDRTRREHLIFSLFNCALAGMMACRSLMLADIGNRYFALRQFQWHCVAGCVATATFVHFTYLITGHPIQKYLPPRLVYLFAALMSALAFYSAILRLAPVGTIAHEYTDNEMGFLFPGYAALIVAYAITPCYLLFSAMRKLRGAQLSHGTASAEPAAEEEAPDLVLLRRHLAPIFRGTLVLMVSVLVDLAWFLNPNTDDALPFSAVGMIFLSVSTASVLGKDIMRSEKQKKDMAILAQARLESLSDAEHQIKNQIGTIGLPLNTAMQGFERGMEREFLKTKIAKALHGTKELQETLVIMLNVARVEAGKTLALGEKVSVDLAALLETLCQKRADLETTPSIYRYSVESALAHPCVFLKATALQQVLYNLIDNAFKYSPEDSLIRVHLSVEENTQQVIVRICDQGIGISLEDHERIFTEPFYRGADHRETPGTGLGLNMARRYVEAMGGSLGVESSGVELGSTFVVMLPYEPDRSLLGTTSAADP